MPQFDTVMSLKLRKFLIVASRFSQYRTFGTKDIFLEKSMDGRETCTHCYVETKFFAGSPLLQEHFF